MCDPGPCGGSAPIDPAGGAPRGIGLPMLDTPRAADRRRRGQIVSWVSDAPQSGWPASGMWAHTPHENPSKTPRDGDVAQNPVPVVVTEARTDLLPNGHNGLIPHSALLSWKLERLIGCATGVLENRCCRAWLVPDQGLCALEYRLSGRSCRPDPCAGPICAARRR